MINPRDDIRVEFDNPDFQLPGWLGYRIRPGRSGYDPLDYQYEASHMQGRIIMSLLRQDWRADNLFHLLLLNQFGIFSVFFPIRLLFGYVSFWLSALMDMGFQGAASLIGIILLIYLIIWLGFCEIDAILEDEND